MSAPFAVATDDASLEAGRAIVLRDVRFAEHRGNASLDVRAGTFLTIVTSPARGGSFFRTLLGLDRPAAGTVRVLDEEPAALRAAALRRFRRRVGSSLLPDGLMANITLRDNVALPLVFGDGCSTAEAHVRADDILTRFELHGWAWRRPADLPPDKRQIASLARAVAARPELLLLHDPFTSVTNADAVRLMRQCREYATTIVAAVHDEDATVCRLADATVAWDETGVREAART